MAPEALPRGLEDIADHLTGSTQPAATDARSASARARSLRRLRGNPCAPEHPPQVDYLLLVDIVTSRGVERLGLRSQGHRVPVIVLPGDSGHALQE